MLPLTVQKLDKDTMLDRYEKVAEALNILDISDKYPSGLSGVVKDKHQQSIYNIAFYNICR